MKKVIFIFGVLFLFIVIASNLICTALLDSDEHITLTVNNLFYFIGLIIGVLSTVILFACVNASSIKSKGLKSGLFGVEKVKTEPAQTLEEQAQDAQDEMNNKVSVPSEDDFTAPAESVNTDTAQAETSSVDTSKMKKYIVKNGDTVESIIKKAYGSYTPERAELIMKANNLKTLDRINIDQELLLPAE